MLSFFSFLIKTINTRSVDTLIIAGDIYDTAVAANEAQSMYYDFLVSLEDTCVKDVVIIAGNHDSPSLLKTTASLLKRHNIHVYTSVENLEPLVLDNRGIILPVPFLRESEIRKIERGETIEEGEDRLKAGIASVYHDMFVKAEEMKLNLPIIATGHLSVSSASSDGEKNKELYLGGLGVVDTSIFSSSLSYVALGHIHKPQSLNRSGTIRYPGSPIPMTFEESRYDKSVVIADCKYGEETKIEIVPVPRSRELITLKGDSRSIKEELLHLKDEGKTGWIAVLLTSPEGASTMKKDAEEILKGSDLELLSTRLDSSSTVIGEEGDDKMELSMMSEEDLFERLLCDKNYTGERREEMLSLFREVMREVDGGADDEN